VTAILDWTIPNPPTHSVTPHDPPVLDEGVRLPDPEPLPASPPADWRDVPIPARMAHLKRDRRGYPIFYTIQPRVPVVDGAAVDFRVLNLRHHILCARHRRCGICGTRIDGPLTFIGGPMCVKARIFGDAGVHEECADYARRVCPYLVNANRNYDERDVPGTYHDPNVIRAKPQRLVLYRATAYRQIPGGEGKPVFLVKPAELVDWFLPDGTYVCRTRPTLYAQ
jgi:hypothetical protein